MPYFMAEGQHIVVCLIIGLSGAGALVSGFIALLMGIEALRKRFGC